jgi:diguanylate cyclase (GGDEF)-like protein
MRSWGLGRASPWLPTVLVLALVLLAGGRLIALSVDQRADQRREAAMVAVDAGARALEREIRAPAASGGGQSTRLAGRLGASKALKSVATAGYDFEVSEVDVAARFRQVLTRSRMDPLDDPARRAVRTPPGFLTDTPRGHLELAIRPRDGWYPVRELATAVGLLAIVAWLLAFTAHDLTHSLARSRAVAAGLRRRLNSLTQQLTLEIEKRQDLQQSIDHARYHDAFTGLPNRRYFMDRLDRALRDVRARRRARLAIVLVDVDRFRLINDTLGHTAGDELMVQAARRFQKAVADVECVLARWGGDQFAVLAPDIASTDAAFGVANALQGALREPFELRKHRLAISAHMGLTCVDSGLQRAEDALREADVALTCAKRHETAKTVAYVPTMGGDAASLVSLEADLHVALERSELKLLFQPIVSLQSLRVVGAEALLRWKHPIEGVLTPEKFLSIAEEAGLIVPITRWIVERACRLGGEWRRRLPPGSEFFISINLSAASLRDPAFPDYVARVMEQNDTPPRSLKFELTEGGLIRNVGAAREVLDRLHAMGVELMLDDFGTGYSSLSYLQLFPFDYLKIDRPLVDRTGSDDTNNRITSAVLQMASGLGLKGIAETVETPAAAQALARMGCDYGQGYFFGPPVEPEEVLQRLLAQGPGPAPRARESEGREDDTLVLQPEWLAGPPTEELEEESERPAARPSRVR